MLPLFYLHGLSIGDFVPAMEQFLGSSAGLSPAAVARLTADLALTVWYGPTFPG